MIAGAREHGALAAEIERALAALVPHALAGHVRTGARVLHDDDVRDLRDPERVLAAPQRVRERATGRALLRALLESDAAIGVLPSRAPALPAGVLASLAHDDTLAIAAVCAAAAAANVRALGVDIERAGAADDLAAEVLRDDERGLDATHAFVAKEATYKAWSALGGRILEHHDVRVAFAAGSFAAVVVDASPVFEARGALAVVRDRVVALVVVA